MYSGINCVNGISLNCRYHLQALRHLYVLAAEPRILVTRDVRTDQACSVDVIVRCDDGREGVGSQQTPCVVPEWSTIKEVIYRTLAKGGPWAVHLTLGQDWGVGRYSRYHL